MMMHTDKGTKPITIIGGGLAGCEAAWQIVSRGIPVTLYEMKPQRFSPAHETEQLAELVCSNSFRAAGLNSAVGLLKEEMQRCNSLFMHAAEATAVPAGKALAVDRSLFSQYITEQMEKHPLVHIVREEVEALPDLIGSEEEQHQLVIVATGPLTAETLSKEILAMSGTGNLAFYDAIAPIIDADSLNRDIIYRKSRWDDDGPGDYLNCPMNKEQYERFITALSSAETVPLHAFEEKAHYFEGCLPIEVMCERGAETLRFGPMKPVGLAHPVSGERFYAVVQLRMENQRGTMYNMVGFQTKLTYPEQERVFRLIPGLEQAEFFRLGSIHRNTFIRAPSLLNPYLQMKKQPELFVAGQLSGVEGYVESAAMGLLAGIHAARTACQKELQSPPQGTALRALVDHLTCSDPENFQPSNVNFGLFPPLEKKMPKKQRGAYRAEQGLLAFEPWCEAMMADMHDIL